MLEERLYTIVLLLSAGINVIMACALFNGNFMYRDYAVYRRSRLLTALTFLIFAVGFLLHYHLEWRTSWPEAASALSTQQWPYTVLLTLGIAVFCYIFYGLADYGSVIDAGTNVTEDINQ